MDVYNHPSNDHRRSWDGYASILPERRKRADASYGVASSRRFEYLFTTPFPWIRATIQYLYRRRFSKEHDVPGDVKRFTRDLLHTRIPEIRFLLISKDVESSGLIVTTSTRRKRVFTPSGFRYTGQFRAKPSTVNGTSENIKTRIYFARSTDIRVRGARSAPSSHGRNSTDAFRKLGQMEKIIE